MAHIERFEDLVAWQKARVLTRDIYRVSRQGAFAKDFGLAGQMQRAAVSIMSNIAEGFERNRRGEFFQFLTIAKSSYAEVRSQLYIAFDCAYIDKETFNQLLAQAEEVARIIGGLCSSVEELRTKQV